MDTDTQEFSGDGTERDSTRRQYVGLCRFYDRDEPEDLDGDATRRCYRDRVRYYPDRDRNKEQRGGKKRKQHTEPSFRTLGKRYVDFDIDTIQDNVARPPKPRH